MADKPIPRLGLGQNRPTYKPAPPPPPPSVPRLILGGPMTSKVPPTPTPQQPAAVTEIPQITLGQDVDTRAPITVTTQQLCSGTYILGVQGVGKSTLLEQIACQLLECNESVIVFDPHGQLIDNIVARMPASRLKDTYHLNLKDRAYPFALNIFACADPTDEEQRDRTRNQVTHAFEKLWPETQRGVYFKKLLRHVIILLIEHPHLTLADVPRLLRDEPFRTRYVDKLENVGSADFWHYDYDALSPARQITESTPLLTRVDELLAEPLIKRILCQPRSTVDVRSLIERRKNLFVSLPINEDAYSKAAGLVGIMLMSLVYATTFSFADLSEEQRPGFSLIVDEFQNFATDEYAKLFSQGRKFRVRQFLAHQYRGQLSDTASDANRDATLSAFTKVVFQTTEPDSRALGSLFLDLERRREVPNLAIDILDKLDRHPNATVKEFAARYVWPLQAGRRDRVGTKRQFYEPVSINSRYAKHLYPPHVTYEQWRRIMCDDSMWSSNGVSREMRMRGESPHEHRDYEMALDYPERDFGAGPVSFNPADLEEALTALNELLYNVQKTRMHCRDIDNPRETLSTDDFIHYASNFAHVVQLERLFTPLLGFDVWRRAEAAVADDLDRLRRLIYAAERGQPPDVAASLATLSRFHRDLEEVVEALIREPITQGGSEVRPADVALSLHQLPLRQAYVRIGSEGHVMRTQQLAPGVPADELDRRRKQLRDQTRRDVCRPVSVRRPDPDEKEAAPPPQPRVQEKPAPVLRIRRSRPLP